MPRFFLALATALAGLMNVLSALYPAFHWRFLLLRDVVSVRVINDSQIVTALLGIFLILLAEGLAKRQQRAMWITLAILLLSALLHLTKGLDYEEAIICIGLAAILCRHRHEFVIASRPITFRNTAARVASFALLYYAYTMLGFRILARWITPVPTPLGAMLEPFRLLIEMPAYHYHGYQAHWFGTSLIVIGAVALAFSSLQVLRPLIPVQRSTASERQRVHELIERYGHDTLSYFALREDRAYFFDSSGEAFLSYRIWRNVALVGGDPVGPSVCVPRLIRDFMEFCDDSGLRPCLLGVGGEHIGSYQDLGLKVLKVGEESLIRLPVFDSSTLKRKVRRAERHCLELGIEAHLYDSPDLPAAYRNACLTISKNWVKAKGGRERGFSMTLGRLLAVTDIGTRVLVAVQEGRVLGFLSFVPVHRSNGWSLDMMRRGMGAPNGLTEFMVLQAARMLRDEGAAFMSLNFASLSSTQESVLEPRALTSTRRFLFDNLSSVYQLKTLYQFNAKFEPEWSSRYLVYGDVLSMPKVIMAVVQAEDPIKFSTVTSMFRR